MTAPGRARRRSGPRARLVTGVLLVVAAVVTGLVLAAAARSTRPVLVAAVDLEAGDTVTAASLRHAEARLDAEQAALVLSPEDLDAVAGHYVRHHVAAGELLQRSTFGRVPKASRVFSFGLDRADVVGGRVRPGDTVDVVASSRTGSATCTRVVAAGVHVVAVQEDDGSAMGGPGVEVTLEVAQADVVAVTHARNTGSMTLALSSGAPTETGAGLGACDTAQAPGAGEVPG